VAVIAVDPSSRASRGALLGDRTRLRVDPEDDGVFIRSMAARDSLGGLAEISFPAMVLLRATHDVVIVETVGVGQSETDIADVADTVIFCAQPGSGDALQFMKAGIMEIPDIVVVTKADMGVVAARTEADLKGALSLSAPSHKSVEVLRCSARDGAGVEAILDACATRQAALARAGDLQRQRRAQLRAHARRAVLTRHGTRGLALVNDSLDSVLSTPVGGHPRPFNAVSAACARLDDALAVGFSQQKAALSTTQNG
jgi:LAO/AO transport system kinase